MKGVLIYLIVDALTEFLLLYIAVPANEDERKHVMTLFEMIAVKTGTPGRPHQKLRGIAADKKFDPLREFLRSNASGRKFQERSMQSENRVGLLSW